MEPLREVTTPPAPKTVANAVANTVFWGALTGGAMHLITKVFKLSPIYTVVTTASTVAQTAFNEGADLVSEKQSIAKYKVEIAKSIAKAVISTIAFAILFGCNLMSPPMAAISIVGGAIMLGVEIYAALNPTPAPQATA
ncbi:MAG: hypothetical protein LLF94_02450 [Chlamydiales bacterium]|nr:hypothetical protein [Chlamydiales bacterium]